MELMPPVAEAICTGSVRPRCHDLAQFGEAGGGRRAAQFSRRAAEEAAEARGEMAVAGKAGIERDGREIVIAIEHGIQRLRQTFLQHVVVDRGADHLAEYMAEMERREVCEPCQPLDAPLV